MNATKLNNHLSDAHSPWLRRSDPMPRSLPSAKERGLAALRAHLPGGATVLLVLTVVWSFVSTAPAQQNDSGRLRDLEARTQNLPIRTLFESILRSSGSARVPSRAPQTGGKATAVDSPGRAAALAAESDECLAVRRYFPLHEGDEWYFYSASEDDDYMVSTTETVFQGRSVFLFGDWSGGLCFSYSGDQILYWGETFLGDDLVLDSPLVWLDENQVLNGGTRTSEVSGWFWGYQFHVKLTVSVSKLGTATVSAGTYGNCRRMSVTYAVSIPGEGSDTSRTLYELAPDAGVIRSTVNDEATQWAELVSGTVNGVSVADLGPRSVLVAPVLTQQPANQTVVVGTLVTFRAAADGSAPLFFQWSRDGENLSEDDKFAGTTSPTLTISDVRHEDVGRYAVTVMNEVCSRTSSDAILNVTPDRTPPTTTIVSPRPGSRMSNAVVTVQGRAKDDARVVEVLHQLNGGPWESAAGTTNWQAEVTLVPGTNVLCVCAIDSSGNRSATNLLRLVFVVTSRLSLTVQGQGSISPDLNGAMLEVGRAYTFTAKPATGSVFSNWVGSAQCAEPTIQFVMCSNAELQANFVLNPFPSLKGAYTGLFYDTNVPAHENAGLVTVALADKGAFSAKVQQGAAKYSFSGQFDLALSAQKIVLRRGTNEVVVTLQLAGGSDRLTGSVSNAAWASELFAYRAAFNTKSNPATQFQGGCNALFPGMVDSAEGPTGHGFALLGVNRSGSVSLKGTLADGCATAQKVPLAANGQWPLYMSLYSGKGSIFGWLTLVDTPTNDVCGTVLWTKPGGVKGLLHPAGFTNETETMGSRYVAPARGTRALDFTNALVLLAGGNLSWPLTNAATLTEQNKIAVDAPNLQKLSLTLTTSAGSFKGSFIHPQTGKASALKGVLLQKQNLGAGFFLGTNQSGRVFFGEVDSE